MTLLSVVKKYQNLIETLNYQCLRIIKAIKVEGDIISVN